MRKENILKYIKLFGTIIAVILFSFFVFNHWNELISNIKLLGILPVILLLIITLVSRFFVSFRWFFLIQALEPEIKLANVIKITFTGLFASNFLPTTIGGDLVRVAGGLQLGYDPVKLSTSLLFDRLVGMVGMVIALPLNIFIPNVVKLLPKSNNTLINQVLIGNTIFNKLKEKTTNIFIKLLNTLKLWKNQPKAVIFSFTSTIGHMICLFITIWYLFYIQKVNIPFSSIAGLWSLSYFFTLLPVSINGLGLQEISITYLYSTIGGASLESCLVTAIMIRILQSFASLPGALFLPSILIKPRV